MILTAWHEVRLTGLPCHQRYVHGKKDRDPYQIINKALTRRRSMIRPPKNTLREEKGTLFATGNSGYRWFFFKEGDLSKEKTTGRAAWAEDDGRHYFTCPFCLAINKAHTDGGVSFEERKELELTFVHNGRDLDSFACEVCRKCHQHLWITFVDAVHRKIWGALKRNKTKCPKCRKAVEHYRQVDYDFSASRPTTSLLYQCCGMRWR